MANTKYRCEFFSDNRNGADEQKWRININSETYSGAVIDFLTTRDGFTLNMDGGDDSMLAPMKTTSVSFNYIIDSVTTDDIISDLLSIAGGNESEFTVEIENYYNNSTWQTWWIGILQGDLAALDDTSPNRIINLKATDGLNTLKYIPYDHDNDGGNRSALQVIKRCLAKITLNQGYYSGGKFLAHTPFYYNKAMLGGSTWNSTWRDDVNHDPLAMCFVNTEVFQDNNGESWSCYKVLEQIVACFQLRIYQTQIHVDSGTAVWFLQSPMVNHGNNNDDGFDSSQLIFYHSKSLSTDVAISFSNGYDQAIYNPTDRIAGGKEMFIPPLLSYKSIYNHNIYNNMVLGPLQFTSTAHQNESTDHSFTTGLLAYNFSNIQDIQPFGCVDDALKSTNMRVRVVGNIHTNVIDAGHSGFDGYNSGKEYWDLTNFALTDDNGINYSVAVDVGHHFPRLGIRVNTRSEAVEAGGYVSSSYWWGQNKFAYLYGSVPWMGGQETDNYPNNYKGVSFGSTMASCTGLAFNISDVYNPLTTATNADGIVLWGSSAADEDIGFWTRTTEAEDNPSDNHYGWCSPVYNAHEVWVISGIGSWVDTIWNASINADYFSQDMPFQVTTGPIPWDRQEADGAYGWSYLRKIQIYLGLERDRVVDSAGNTHYACAKDWTSNIDLECGSRGVHWLYTYSDVRVYVIGSQGDADLFDSTIACWENGNGTPSDEDVQSPEIVIGDHPVEPNVTISNNNPIGSYIGEFQIFTQADPVGGMEEGSDVQDWRTIHMTGSEDMNLHIHRAKMALAHRYMLKYKVELNFRDQNSDSYGVKFILNRTLFSSILRWTTAGNEWEQNSAATDIAFLPTGGSFTAGTGDVKLILEDCVTYSKNNLTDKSYSTNG